MSLLFAGGLDLLALEAGLDRARDCSFPDGEVSEAIVFVFGDRDPVSSLLFVPALMRVRFLDVVSLLFALGAFFCCAFSLTEGCFRLGTDFRFYKHMSNNLVSNLMSEPHKQ